MATAPVNKNPIKVDIVPDKEKGYLSLEQAHGWSNMGLHCKVCGDPIKYDEWCYGWSDDTAPHYQGIAHHKCAAADPDIIVEHPNKPLTLLQLYPVKEGIGQAVKLEIAAPHGWGDGNSNCIFCNRVIGTGQWTYWMNSTVGSGTAHFKCAAANPDSVPDSPAYPWSFHDEPTIMIGGYGASVPKLGEGKEPAFARILLKFLPPVVGEINDRIIRRYWPDYHKQLKQTMGDGPGWTYKKEKETSTEAYKLWGLPVVRLPKEAAEFYLLEYMVGVHEYEPAREVYEQKIQFLAGAFSAYLNMAIGGELRHMCRMTDYDTLGKIEKDLFPYYEDIKPRMVPRSAAWLGWHEHFKKRGVQVVSLAYEIFDNQHKVHWEGGFGGKAWAKIAETLLLFLSGKLKPKLFVDRVWSIQHNGGTALDKAPEMFRGLSHLKDVLDAQSRTELSFLYQHCGGKVQQLFDEFQRIV